MVLISTHMSEVGEEQFSEQFHKEAMSDLVYSMVLRCAASAGKTSVKVCVCVCIIIGRRRMLCLR